MSDYNKVPSEDIDSLGQAEDIESPAVEPEDPIDEIIERVDNEEPKEALEDLSKLVHSKEEETDIIDGKEVIGSTRNQEANETDLNSIFSIGRILGFNANIEALGFNIDHSEQRDSEINFSSGFNSDELKNMSKDDSTVESWSSVELKEFLDSSATYGAKISVLVHALIENSNKMEDLNKGSLERSDLNEELFIAERILSKFKEFKMKQSSDSNKSEEVDSLDEGIAEDNVDVSELFKELKEILKNMEPSQLENAYKLRSAILKGKEIDTFSKLLEILNIENIGEQISMIKDELMIRDLLKVFVDRLSEIGEDDESLNQLDALRVLEVANKLLEK